MGGCAVVTGASSGIGAATALSLARSGIPVVAAARSASATYENISGLDGVFRPIDADLTLHEEVDRVFNEAEGWSGPVRVVIHSVGFRYDVEWFDETSADSVVDAVAGLVTSPALVLHRAIRSMRGSGGVIGLVSSGAAAKPTPGRALYGPAKNAVDHLVATVGAECAAHHPEVGVFAISPGRVNTPARQRLMQAARSAPSAFLLEPFRSGEGVADAATVGAAIATLAQGRPQDLNGGVYRYRADAWERLS